MSQNNWTSLPNYSLVIFQVLGQPSELTAAVRLRIHRQRLLSPTKGPRRISAGDIQATSDTTRVPLKFLNSLAFRVFNST